MGLTLFKEREGKFFGLLLLPLMASDLLVLDAEKPSLQLKKVVVDIFAEFGAKCCTRLLYC